MTEYDIDKDFARNIWCILGLPFDALNIEQAVEEVISSTTEKRRCFLSTPNLNFLCAAQDDILFRQSVINSDLSIADGSPIILIARLLDIPLPERVAGSNLIEHLFVRKTDSPLKVFFFGGEMDAGKKASQRINQSNAGLCSVGDYYPGFGSINEMSTSEIINEINSACCDFLIVSLGAKKGQFWIEKNRHQLNVPVISHLGAVINFFAGTVKRAPVWVQRWGSEWLWRIYQEPGLWRRYVNDGISFIGLLLFNVLPYWFWLKLNKFNFVDGPSADVKVTSQSNIKDINFFLSGICCSGTIEPLRNQFKNIALRHQDIVIDLTDVTVVDGAFMGLCLVLYKYLSISGNSLLLINANKEVKRIFKWNKVDYLLG